MDWHFELLKDNQRMKFPISNVAKMREKPQEMADIRTRADELRSDWGVARHSRVDRDRSVGKTV